MRLGRVGLGSEVVEFLKVRKGWLSGIGRNFWQNS